MNEGISQVFQATATGLGVLGILAAALAVVRSGHTKATLELLRGEVSDLHTANARLEGENTKLNQEVTVLRDMVTSRANVEELTVEVRTLVGVIRADYADLAKTMATLVGGKHGSRRAGAGEHDGYQAS